MDEKETLEAVENEITAEDEVNAEALEMLTGNGGEDNE